MDYIKYVDTPLGKVLLSSDGKALTGLWFEGQKHFGSTLSDECVEKNVGVFDLAERWLDVYHPHVHCIVSGAGLTRDHRLVKSGKSFFIPIKHRMDRANGTSTSAVTAKA